MAIRIASACMTLCTGCVLLAASLPARGEDYFAGKQISMVIGYNPGGGYDIYARIIASSLSRHIPGTPTVVPRNMPGAGSAVAANFLYTVAAKDGTAIGMVGQQMALAQALGDKSVRFDMRRFTWLGRVAKNVEVSVAWHTAPVKSMADAINREITLAATSAGSTSHSMPLLMNRIAGTKFKLVTGYPGITGGGLAMERGETQGTHATIDGLLFNKANWMRDRQISVLVQYAMERHPSLPDVPAMTEFGNTTADKMMLALFASPAEIGRSVLAPPGVPADAVAILRRAFDSLLADKSLEEELTAKKLTFEPLSGAGLQKLIDTVLAISPELAQKAAALGRE